MPLLRALLVFIALLGPAGFVLADLEEDANAAYDRGDYTTALRIARQLADADNPWSMHFLGVMYREGRGVRKDHKEAAWWFFKDIVTLTVTGQTFTVGCRFHAEAVACRHCSIASARN